MKKIVFGFAAFTTFFLTPVAVYSAVVGSDPVTPPVLNGGILPGPTDEEMRTDTREGVDYIKDQLVPGVVNMFVIILLALSVGMLVLAGYFFVFNTGGTETKEKAKNIIIWTVVGVIIAILAVAIVKIVIGINFTLS